MKIYIGTDHQGVDYKNNIIDYLKNKNIDIISVDVPNHSTDDYTDFAFEVGKKVVENNALGIVICGNGIGISIAANKVKGIRAARVLTPDDAYKCKNHNGANIIALGADNELSTIFEIIDTFIDTPSATEERHLRRISKIVSYEENNK